MKKRANDVLDNYLKQSYIIQTCCIQSVIYLKDVYASSKRYLSIDVDYGNPDKSSTEDNKEDMGSPV